MKKYSIIGLFVLAGLTVHGQTMESYLQMAGENNPALKAQYHRYQAALEKVPQAGGLPDPEMGFSFFLQPMERYMGNQVGNVSIMQMFPWFGSLKAGKDEAAYMAKMEFERFVQAKIDLFYQVKTLWYQLYQVDRERLILSEELALLNQLEDLVLTKYKASALPAGNGGEMVDVLLVQLQIKELESKMALLDNSEKPLRIAFNKLLNRETHAAIAINDTLEPARIPAALSLVSEAAIQDHPMLKMAEWDEQARVAQQRMAKLMGKPKIGLGLEYMLFKPRAGAMDGGMHGGNGMVMPMATLTIPIYRKKYNAQRKEAAFQREAAIRDREAAANQLVTELGQLMNGFEEAEVNLELIGEQIAVTEQTLRLMTTAYQVGKTTMEELVRQRQNLLRYQVQRLTALTDQHKTVAAINRIIGVDNE